jgi:hypothetical protein
MSFQSSGLGRREDRCVSLKSGMRLHTIKQVPPLFLIVDNKEQIAGKAVELVLGIKRCSGDNFQLSLILDQGERSTMHSTHLTAAD